jgi:hypothetical protein
MPKKHAVRPTRPTCRSVRDPLTHPVPSDIMVGMTGELVGRAERERALRPLGKRLTRFCGGRVPLDLMRIMPP